LWERAHPGLLSSDDSDADGFTNAEEAAAGTNPLSGADHPKITCERNGEAKELRWQGVIGKDYRIEQWNPTLNEWSEVARRVATGGTLVHTIESGAPSGFFRIRVGDVDEDGDGLSAWEEAMLGFSDGSMRSSGDSGRLDYSAALRRLEGSGDLTLADGTIIPKQSPTNDEAVRFLAQSSFGADPDLIEVVRTLGIGGWLDQQLNPVTQTMTSTDLLVNNGPVNAGTYPWMWTRSWWRAAMTAPDQVRLRMGYALSQILVISAAGIDAIRGTPQVQADYYDILLQHALGNYRNLLEDVTYSTQMGVYLSHIQNRKSDPAIGRFPDENFAREIMQLFTIGLWELNPDGSRKLNGTGLPIPTYDNNTIMGMAKVFTGFGFGGPNATDFFSSVGIPQWVHPMKMWDDQHEPGEKSIIGGVVIPAGQTGAADIDSALDALCAHPNIGPFIGRLLIQRFTSSNPSPAYIRRVAAAWDDNGAGTRGDMKSVLDAVLMDPEARTPEARGDASGMIREPYLRIVALMRAFKARNSRTPPTFPVVCSSFPTWLGQQPLWAPSVFNFYLPDHRPAGELRDRGLFSPEMEIASTDRLINTENFIQRVIDRGMDPFTTAAADVLFCDFSHAQSISANAGALVDYLDSLLTWGSLSATTRQAVITAVQSQATAELKVEAAVHLIVESPDFVVLK
jgi:uncharacterized protein (DUF1800 family)